MAEMKKREVAYKLRIGDILAGNPVIDNEKLNFLELGDKKISRVNIVANVIDKFSSESERRFANMVLDDASGQITVRAFGEDTKLFDEISQGHTILVIGVLRVYNNEVYILPELIRIQDPRYLLIRKLEIEKSVPKQEVKKEQILAIKDKIMQMIKDAEQDEGIDADKIIMALHASPDIVNQEIRRLLEEGIIYEPKPGRLRYLG